MHTYSNRKKKTVIQRNVVYNFIRCMLTAAAGAAAAIWNGLFTILFCLTLLKVPINHFNISKLVEALSTKQSRILFRIYNI